MAVKNLPANAGDARDAGSIPESERSPGVGHGNLLLYSCLENPMDKGPWWLTVHGVTKTQLSNWAQTSTHIQFSVKIPLQSPKYNYYLSPYVVSHLLYAEFFWQLFTCSHSFSPSHTSFCSTCYENTRKKRTCKLLCLLYPLIQNASIVALENA